MAYKEDDPKPTKDEVGKQLVLPRKMDGAPPQIEKLVQVLEGLPGVVEVDCGAIPLEEFDLDHVSLVSFGDLPHASLLRSSGGLPGEALGQFFVRFDRSDTAWTSIEFLSWQVRDCSRAGKRYQMRSLGLPPVIGNEIQLGQSLRFVVELFQDGLDDDPESLLSAVGEFADSIRSSLDIYGLEWCDGGVTKRAEQGVDPNAWLAPSSIRHGHSTTNPEVGVRPRSGVG